MAVQIQFRRGTAAEWTLSNPKLAEAEMGIETDTSQFKIGDGERLWVDLPYGGIQGDRGNTGYVGSFGNMAVANVLYVSKSGNDSFPGNTLNQSKLTIKAALAACSPGTTIFVKSGDYTEANPMIVPRDVSVIGDNLRSVTVRPATPTEDLFWVNNGSYLAHMTFKEHASPGAAVAFNPDGSAGVITQSPYVQNCTSITGDGTGMRIDGDLAQGTKSMVVDAYTQYNQGGIGIHLLNRGYAQLVSVFTICCDKGFFAEKGGFCSITNSNSSFGNYALYADGVSDPLQISYVTTASRKTVVLNNLTSRPSIGDAVQFGSNATFYTVNSSTELRIGSTSVVNPTISNEGAPLRNARQAILNKKNKIQIDTIIFLNETYPTFQFNQFLCNRDIATILNCVCYDMVLGTNYQSVTAGIAYTRASAFAVENSQKTETLAAINFVKTAALAAITPSTTAYDRISSNFDIVLDIIQNGTSAIPAITYPNPTVIDPNIETAKYQIQNNKEFIKAETLEYIDRNFINFSYNKEKCARDTGLIIDGLVTDLLFPSNGYTQSNFAGLQYWSQSTYVGIIGEELTTTTNAIRFINSLTQEIILNQQVGPRYQGTLTQVINLTPATSTEVNKLENEFDRILYILNTGTVGITDSIVSPGITAVNTNSQYAYNILQANKNYIKSETIAYINDQNPGFAYDTGVCGRDVGFMIDCVSFDILYGGNRQATQAGVYYYDYISTSSVIATELLQTTQTYDRLKEILPKLVTNKSIIASFGNTSTQNTSLTTSTSVQGAQLQAMVSKITAIINNGPSAADAKVAIGLTKSTATNVINAAEIILANKDFLVSEIISYADRSFSGFLYNEVKCYRDTGLIVDSIVQDLLFSTSSQSTFAGLQYWSQDGYVGEIINEVSTTSNIIRYINGLAQEIVQNSTGTRYQSGVQQIISTSTIATTATVNIIDARFTDIDQILLTGIIGITDQIIPNGIVASTSTNIINAYNILQANKYYMVTEGLYKVINDNPSFMFDQNICARDLGFMIDSVCFDLLYGGNKQSIQSGAAYYSYVSTSSVIASETTQTLAAYAYIDSITQSIILGHKIPTVYQTAVSQITNLSTATVTEGTALSGLITNITDIIRDGPSAAAPLRPIRLTRSTNQNVINAAAMLHANRTFIQEEVIAWTNYRFQNLNRDVCARDIGYVLDALTYDLMYSGNSQMFVAGSAYYSGTILSVKDEIVSVLDAYSFINSLTQKIILSQPVTPLQLVQTQDFDAGPATITEVVKVDTLFDLLNDILSNGFTSTITLEETLRTPPAADEVATFYQYSLIVSTGHSFEWIGAGTNIDSALPYLGGTPIVENQGYEINGGRVNFTGTDQRGDFRIGNDLVFNRNNGTISGRTFTKSLFAVMTPYILSIGG